jgi:hypothetical protein
VRKEGGEEEEEEEEEAAISSASSVQEVDTWYAVCCCWLCGRVWERQEEWYSAACGAVRDSFLYSRFGSRFQEDLRV